MPEQVPGIPLTFTQTCFTSLATILAALGAWLAARQSQTETSETGNAPDVLAVVETAKRAVSKAERLQQERFHWQYKCEDVQKDLSELRYDHGQLETRHRLVKHDVKKLKALLDFHHISYSKADMLRLNLVLDVEDD